MRILWIKTELLHPVDKGGRIRTYQMLRSLTKQHHVTYLCLDDGTAAPNARALATEYCHQLETVPFNPPAKGGLRFFLDLILNLFSPLPYAIARYRSAELRARIAELAPNADLVVCDFLTPSVNVPDELPSRRVLFQHNVESMIWERHVTVPQHAIRKIYMRQQWRKMERFESRMCQFFDHVVAVSNDDARVMKERYHVASVSAVATGVDIAFFAHRSTPAHLANNEVVFVGSMDWMPNEDGIRWFAESVFPEVRLLIPNAQLTVVGRSPPASMKRLASREAGIDVVGTVPDVRPYWERAAVSIVPLRIGGGTRLKIFEAMAMGIPIVSTSVGAEGLPVAHGDHLLIADTPEAQAAAIVSLLRDRDAARLMADRARDYVAANCSWDAVAEQFVAACTKGLKI
ncbi:MAG TPA: glycosyltransferase [Steroidobacteraceae bacterium]|nr:glycosyltransferase [Steroidobacteraceae bacterium]